MENQFMMTDSSSGIIKFSQKRSQRLTLPAFGTRTLAAIRLPQQAKLATKSPRHPAQGIACLLFARLAHRSVPRR
jgi:hypothetical protein